ncbi:MAG: VPLPA-CTERM sorting domain-containing protein [Pseudomonadota bacterium]
MRILAAAALALAAFAAPAAATTLVAYTSVNGDFITPDQQGFGVTGLSLTRAGGLSQIGNANRFRSNGFATSDLVQDAVNDGDYITFGFDSSVGYDLDQLGVRFRVNGNGPQAVLAQIAVDGGAYEDVALLTPSTDQTSYLLDLSTFNNVTDADFRLIGFDAVTDNGRLILGNTNADPFNGGSVVVTGDQVAPVPLPAAGGLLLIGAGAIVALRRKA